MRRLLPLLLAAAAPAPQPATGALVGDTEARWVAFDLTPGNQIRFLMTLDGRPVTAILDTGVSTSVLSRRYAAANGLAVGAGGRAATIGGTVDVGTVATTSLSAGGMVRTGGTLAVVDLPATATGSADAVDLLVGQDLTAPFALDIDYRQRRFRFLKSGRIPFAGVAAPLAIAPERQVYVSSVTIAGRQVRPVVVDTGDGSMVTLSGPAWSDAKLAPAVTSTISYGIAGPVTSDLAIVPALSVGQATARDVEVRIEPAGGFSETIRVAGRIGSGFLQRYRVLLDPRAGHMLLASEPAAAVPPVRSTSGLLLGIARDRLRVLHVMRGGPAAAGGWREGETICAVDGITIGPSYAASAAARWVTGAPGTSVTLRLCDGEERRLTLRRFY